MNQLFAIAAVLLVVIAYVPYLVKIARGTVKPHPFTWLVWSITATSIFILQTSYGSGAGAYATATMATFSLCVFVLTIRSGVRSINLIDVVCLVMALLGVAVWLIVQEPTVSIVILLSVEFIGFIPTFIKGMKKPYEDSATLWGLTGARHTMSLMAVQHYNIVTMLNPISWMVVASIFCSALLIRRIPVKKPRKRVRAYQPYS